MRPSLSIRSERCKGCEMCIGACPKGVISMSGEMNTAGYSYAEVSHPELCTSCRLCAIVCPEVGITIGSGRKGELP